MPDGLDLDAWIVQPPVEALPQSHVDDDDDAEKKKKKSKKGKGKEVSGSSTNRKKKKAKDTAELVVLTPAESDQETQEEKAERERVCIFIWKSREVLIVSFLFNSARQNDWHNYGMTHITSLMIDLQSRQLKTSTQYQSLF